jgi:hypothetical protein
MIIRRAFLPLYPQYDSVYYGSRHRPTAPHMYMSISHKTHHSVNSLSSIFAALATAKENKFNDRLPNELDYEVPSYPPFCGLHKLRSGQYTMCRSRCCVFNPYFSSRPFVEVYRTHGSCSGKSMYIMLEPLDYDGSSPDIMAYSRAVKSVSVKMLSSG